MKRLYFISITVLALASIVLMFLELGGVISLTEAPFKQVDAAIILIFTVDYIARFCMAKERKKFFKGRFLSKNASFGRFYQVLLTIKPFSKKQECFF